jgi:hypothetical protein
MTTWQVILWRLAIALLNRSGLDWRGNEDGDRGAGYRPLKLHIRQDVDCSPSHAGFYHGLIVEHISAGRVGGHPQKGEINEITLYYYVDNPMSPNGHVAAHMPEEWTEIETRMPEEWMEEAE